MIYLHKHHCSIVVVALRIHLSDDARVALEKFDGFVIDLRGETLIKVRFYATQSDCAPSLIKV